MRKPIWPVLLGLLLPAAPAPAEEFNLMLSAFVFLREPAHGGTLHVAQARGDGLPTGPVEGFLGFVLDGARFRDGLVVLADERGDVLFLVAEGRADAHSFEGLAVPVGGTGRYASATGALNFYGQDEGGDQLTFVFTGIIEF